MKTTQGAAPNYIMPTTQVPRPRIEPKTFRVTCSYFTTLPLRQIKVKAWTWTGHLGCGHYVVRSYTLSCFQYYPRLKLTFTIIAMQKSRSHPPFIHYSRFYISLFIDFFYAKENHFLQKIYFKIDLWMFSHRGAEKAPMCPIGLNLGFTLIKMKKTSLKIEYNSIFWCKIFLKSWCILYFMIYLLRPIMQLTIWSRLSNSFD